MNKVLSEEEFLAENPTATIINPEKRVPTPLRGCLDQDISQMAAADAAIKQKVTLIQG
jgi:hypothetical protein